MQTTMMQATTRFKIWLVLLGVFALGAATGAALDRAFSIGAHDRNHKRHGRQGNDKFFDELRRDLNLSEQQASEVRRILDEKALEFRRLRDETRPRFDEMRRDGDRRIRQMLDSDQQKIFDAKITELDMRRQHRNHNRQQ